MMSKEAMKLALEALESCGAAHITDGGSQWYDEKLVDTAYAALQEALAEQPAQQDGPINEGWQITVANGHSGYGLYAHMEDYPEEGAVLVQTIEQPAQQEPVAWMDGPHLVMRSDWRERANYKGPWVDFGRAIPDSWAPVLYTSPPAQRKPLTREIIERDFYGRIDFVRAIEAAHGIKENT